MNRKNLKQARPCSFEEICRDELQRQKGISSLFYHLGKFDFGVWIWYGLENRLFLSTSFSRMVGIPSGMVPTLELLVECIHPGDLDRFFTFLETLVDGLLPGDLTFRVCLPDGNIRTICCIIGTMGGEWVGVYDVVGVCWELDN